MILASLSLPLPYLACLIVGWIAGGAVKSHRAYEAGIRAGIAKVERWQRSQERTP